MLGWILHIQHEHTPLMYAWGFCNKPKMVSAGVCVSEWMVIQKMGYSYTRVTGNIFFPAPVHFFYSINSCQIATKTNVNIQI